MTVTADANKRVVLPQAQPGDTFDVQLNASGQVVLTRVLPGKGAVSYARKDGLLLAVTDQPITWEATRKALDEFP